MTREIFQEKVSLPAEIDYSPSEAKQPAQLPFAISFTELGKLAEHLPDKAAIHAVLADIQLKMDQLGRFFPIHNKALYYPSIYPMLEAVDRLIEQIPRTPGGHHTLRATLQKAIRPLQKTIQDFFLQEEGISDPQLAVKTHALYVQQALIMRDKTIRAALNNTLLAIQHALPKECQGLRCFISYAWPLAEHQEKEHWLQPFLRVLHGHLRQAGIKPTLDIVDNQAGGNIVTFANQIKTSEFAVLICTESLVGKHQRPQFKVVQTELSLLKQKYDIDIAMGQVRVFPLLMSGSRASATLPEHNLYRTVRDWRVQSYLKNLEQLIGWICYPQGVPETYPKIWQDFYAHYPTLARSMSEDSTHQELSLHWHRRDMDKLASEGFYQKLVSQQHPPAPPLVSTASKSTREDKRAHAPTAISYNLPKPLEEFIGRETLLKALAAQFTAPGSTIEKETKATQGSNLSVSSRPQKLVLCTGLGGVGKTQLAVQYAHTTKPYLYKFWFTADSPDALSASYRVFAKEQGLMDEGYISDQAVIHAVMQWLADHPHWLIIYDNVERYADVAPYLPTQGTGDILLTSRSAPNQWPKSITPLVVDVLSPKEANQLIASLIDTPNDPDIPALAMLLGCLPLALVQACAYIRENSMPVAAYLKAYTARAKYLLQQVAAPAGFPPHDPVFVTWDISLDAIAKEEKAKGKQVPAKQLLEYCAFLDPQKIPSCVLETWHDQTYPATQEFMTEARGRLHAYSLLQLDPADQSIQVHRLVQQVMRERLSAEERATQLQQTMKLLTAAYPEKNVSVGKVWDMVRFGFIPHLEAVITYHAQYQLAEDINLSLALCLLADAYGELGQVGKKRALLERALAIDEAHYGKDHYRVAITLTNLGDAYRVLGEAGKARELLERALAIFEAHYGKAHYQVARTLMNLGAAYGELGQAGKQRELLERALAIFEAHYGKEHYLVAITLNNLGDAYRVLGEAGKARKLLERALAIKEAHYGKEHYQVAMTLTNLGNAYGELGQVGKQRELLERALAILEAHYGKEHYLVAITLNNLGVAYYAQGKVSKSQELWERALAIQEAHYGPAYPKLAITLTNLAVACQELNQPQAALQAAQRTYRILMTHPDYGAEHPKTKRCLQLLQSAGGFTLAMLQNGSFIPEVKQLAKSSASASSTPAARLLAQHGLASSSIQKTKQALGHSVLALLAAIHGQRQLDWDPKAPIHFTARVVSAFAKGEENFDQMCAVPEKYLIPATLSKFIQTYVAQHPELRELSNYPSFARSLETQLMGDNIDALYTRFDVPKPEDKTMLLSKL